MELTRKEIRDALENPAFAPKFAAKRIERFEPKQLAALLEREVRLCERAGFSHVALNMTLPDCMALVRHLRGHRG